MTSAVDTFSVFGAISSFMCILFVKTHFVGEKCAHVFQNCQKFVAISSADYITNKNSISLITLKTTTKVNRINTVV